MWAQTLARWLIQEDTQDFFDTWHKYAHVEKRATYILFAVTRRDRWEDFHAHM